MTAVEWLEQQLGSKIADANIRISAPKFYELINQAKEMFEQQIIDAYSKGCKNPLLYSTHKEKAEQYYNETFKSK